MKKRRYFLPLAVGILTVAVTGGVIFAQNSHSPKASTPNRASTARTEPLPRVFTASLAPLLGASPVTRSRPGD